jgi:putative ABC transport system permease protein
MIRNYLKISLRHLLRNRSYALINILGLTLGVAGCTIIFLMISKEYRYDKVHNNYEQIYRINRVSENASGKDYSSKTPYPLKEALENDLTELKQLTRFHLDHENILEVEDGKLYEEENIIFTDTSFYDVFDFGGGVSNNVLQ